VSLPVLKEVSAYVLGDVLAILIPENDTIHHKILTVSMFRCSVNVSTLRMTYEDKNDLTSKVRNFFLQIMGIPNNVFEPNLVQRPSILKMYNILAIPSPLHRCEMWILKVRDTKSLKTTEMEFMRRTAG